MQFGDFETGLNTQCRIEVGERFIKQEGFGLTHNGPADRHALALAAGEIGRLTVEQCFELQDLRGLADPEVALFPRDAGEAQGERHIIGNRHMRIKRITLKDHRKAAAVRRNVIDELAVDPQFTARDVFQAGDHAQERGFSGARRPDKDDEFAVVDFQVDPLDDFNRTEAFA